MYDRMDSVNSLLKREISRVVRDEVKDPRLAKLTSIVSVETSRNLQTATVHVSVMGEPSEKRKTIKGLNSATGFIHRVLRRSLDIRSIPRITFVLDDSLDRAEKISELIDSISKRQGSYPTEPVEGHNQFLIK